GPKRLAPLRDYRRHEPPLTAQKLDRSKLVDGKNGECLMSTTKNPTGLDQRRIRQAFIGEVERLNAQLDRVTHELSPTEEHETDPAGIAMPIRATAQFALITH